MSFAMRSNVDGRGMSLAMRFSLDVMPAKAGIQFDLRSGAKWIPAVAGMTTVGGVGGDA
jgi:hypothetical protein